MIAQKGSNRGGLLERGLAKMPAWAVPRLVAELVARLGGIGGSSLLNRPAAGTEDRLRGVLFASRYQAMGLRIGRGVTIIGANQVSLGEDVTLYGNVFLDASGPRGRIRIGRRSHVDRNTVLYGQGGITIGDGCAIAAGVIVYSQTNQFRASPTTPIIEQETLYAEVTVGDDVWIGAGAVLLPGVRIGNHAVVAAGAVVRGPVEPWSVVGGVPARVLGDRRQPR